MGTKYEMDVESIDAEGDVQDHNFANLAELNLDEIDGVSKRLVLVKSIDSEIRHRSWAYTKRDEFGKLVLPTEFEDGTKVPMIYHEILKNVQ